MKSSYSKVALDKMDFLERLNLINSITGVKSANLIGTKSVDGKENLAIVSSVVHLGSSPALIGFVMRPPKDGNCHTYSNIFETNYYTINSVGHSFVEKAHYTSAKFVKEASEFELCKLTPLYKKGFYAPFVKESAIQIGMKISELLPIKQNGVTLIVGEVESVKVKKVQSSGMLNLEELNVAGASGLNSYYSLKKIDSFPYAKPDEIPDFK